MRKAFWGSILMLLFLLPQASFAASAKLSYGAWIPFWKKTAGVQEITDHLLQFQQISPFSYEVKANGDPVDKLKIDEGFWPMWLLAIRDLKIKIIPSIAWFDDNGLHALLSNTKLRRAHADKIVKLTVDKKFDGIDIDYENKLTETGPYFSLFLQGLSDKLHAKKKILTCTIEPRMPPADKFKTVPKDLGYANDYKVINKYCDQVRIMAYDQGTIDLKLNAQKGQVNFYAPVADPEWVAKVIKETAKTISRKKIVLGIPTYGYEFEVSRIGDSLVYKRFRSHTYSQAIERATALGLTPYRNNAGEMSFVYATSTTAEVSKSLTFKVDLNSTSTITTTTNTSSTPVISQRFISYTDAQAIKDKIDLAKKEGLAGVILFKLDGETDPALWDKIK